MSMSDTVIYSDLNKIRMVFDCDTKKAMSIPDGEYELRTNMMIIVWIQTISLHAMGNRIIKCNC